MRREIVLIEQMIFQKKNAIRHTYESLASGLFILGIVVIVDSKPMNLCYRCYNNIFNIYFLMCIILKYIEILI